MARSLTAWAAMFVGVAMSLSFTSVVSARATRSSLMTTQTTTQSGREQQIGLTSTVYGYGAQSCGKYLQDKKDLTFSVGAAQWLLGWVSAFSVVAATKAGEPGQLKPLAKSDSAAMTAWVNNYCAEHPLDSISQAAMNLVSELIKKSEEQRK